MTLYNTRLAKKPKSLVTLNDNGKAFDSLTQIILTLKIGFFARRETVH